MPDGEIDLVEQILGSAANPSAGSSESAGPNESAATPPDNGAPGSEGSSPATPIEAAVPAAPERRHRLRNPLSRRGRTKPVPGRTRPRSRLRSAVQLIVAFILGAAFCLGLFAAVVLGINNQYANRIAPGVHVGALDLGGMTRDQAVAALDQAYSYLGQGKVTVTTPTGTATLTYLQAGRGPDSQFMADQAMQIGHTGNLLDDAVNIGRAAFNGQSIPLAVHIDPAAIATGVRQLVDQNEVPPSDAGVTLYNGIASYSPAVTGARLDELSVLSAIVSGLATADAPADFQVGQTFVTLAPDISDADAQRAIAASQRMFVAVRLAWTASGATPTPTPAKSPLASSDPFTIDVETVRGWITIGHNPDGTIGPVVDGNAVQSTVAKLTSKLLVAPKEPKVTFDSTGRPATLTGGQDGMSVDAAATSQAVVSYLESLAKGGAVSETPIEMAVTPVHPRITLDSLKGMVLIGAWTTTFYPGITNGMGVNIRLPAKLLDGQVVPAGGHFSFLRAVGPIDRAHGWTTGGVIESGKSDHTGAIGGGICSASTTMFNAAARAGLQIDERHAHYYYIDRYPVGLDATVYSNGVQTWDIRWTNDTANPIIIHSWTNGRSVSHMIVQLWSLPTGRTVTFSPQFKANVVKASDHTVYTTKLKPGQTNRAEYPTAGFDTSRIRTVKDSTGKVIHSDTWISHYKKVDGLLQIGVAASTPAPTPAPTGAVFLPGAFGPVAPAPTSSPRLRRSRS